MPNEMQKSETRVQMFPTRAAWLAARSADRTAIGASEAAVALGVSPYATAWDLWEHRQGQQSAASSDVLRRGNRWESAVLSEYEDVSGNTIVSPGEHFGQPGSLVILSHPDYPWLRESPDAFVLDGDELGHGEAKTAMHAHEWAPEIGTVVGRWTDDCAEIVPPQYAVQCYVQLAVSGLPWNDLCALVPGGGWLEVRWVRMMRDEETQGQIIEQLSAWRDRHLVQGVPPSTDGSAACSRHLALRFPRVEKLSREATIGEQAAMIKLANARFLRDEYEELAKETSNRIMESAAGAKLTLPGPAKTAPYGQPQPVGGEASIDVAKLRAEHPEIAAACTVQRAASATFRTYRFERE